MKTNKSTSPLSQYTEFQPYVRYRAANIAFNKPDVTAGKIRFTLTHLILALLISLSQQRIKITH